MITRIYANEYVTLDYDSTVPCVNPTFIKFITTEEFKSILNSGLDFAKEKIKEGERMMWLADTRQSPVYEEESVKWAIEDWTPRVLDAGITHMAFVVPEDELARMGVDDFMKGTKKDTTVEKGLTTAYFKDVESAKNWFRNLIPPTIESEE